jgi:hypothetical protein
MARSSSASALPAAAARLAHTELRRMGDGRFAFSREHADWELLRKSGRMKGL